MPGIDAGYAKHNLRFTIDEEAIRCRSRRSSSLLEFAISPLLLCFTRGIRFDVPRHYYDMARRGDDTIAK